MAEYNCLRCGKKLDVNKDEMTLVANEGIYHYLCLECADEVEFVDIWKLGSEKLGWYYSDDKQEALACLSFIETRQEVMLQAVVMTNVEYERLPKISKFYEVKVQPSLWVRTA